MAPTNFPDAGTADIHVKYGLPPRGASSCRRFPASDMAQAARLVFRLGVFRADNLSGGVAARRQARKTSLPQGGWTLLSCPLAANEV